MPHRQLSQRPSHPLRVCFCPLLRNPVARTLPLQPHQYMSFLLATHLLFARKCNDAEADFVTISAPTIRLQARFRLA